MRSRPRAFHGANHLARSGIAPFLLLAVLFVSAAGSDLTARPNILFIFADDMRSDSIGALGHPVIKTPNIDTLVERGLTFTNAYCMGGNLPAVCMPSRNMLLSGQAYFRWIDHLAPGGSEHRRGWWPPRAPPNLPWSLREAGYQTYHHSKRINTSTAHNWFFETNRYLDDDNAERRSGRPGGILTDDAIEFLRTRDVSRPFFMLLAYANPHDPWVPAAHDLALYDEATIPLPENFLPVHPFDNGEMTVRDETLLPWPRPPAGLRRQLRDYYAVVTGLDSQVGRLLQALDELHLAEDTLVIFSADNGLSLGAHGLLGKQNLYEGAMRCPLIFAGPGVRRGRSDALLYLLDLYPTLCEIAGASVPSGIDGISFKPILDGVAQSARPRLLLAYRDVQRAVRDDRWKLICYPQVGVTQLFDLTDDPGEMRDLSTSPAGRQRVPAMLADLRALQRTFGDSLPLSAETPQPSAWTPPAPIP